MVEIESLHSITVDMGGMTSAKLVTTINSSGRVINKLLATCLGHHGLTVAQWSLLGAIIDGPLTPSGVARYLHIETAYVAIILRQLRERREKLLTETSILRDTRSKAIGLSSTGLEFVQMVEEKLQVCLRRELGQKIAPADLETFFSVAEYIANNVKHSAT